MRPEQRQAMANGVTNNQFLVRTSLIIPSPKFNSIILLSYLGGLATGFINGARLGCCLGARRSGTLALATFVRFPLLETNVLVGVCNVFEAT